MSEQNGKAPKKKRGVVRSLARALLLVLGPLALAGVGAYYYVITGRYVTTENAYVKMDKIAVSADVSGHVSHVAVADYDPVEAGQILFRLDDARYRIALARREAEYQTARQEVGSLRALYRQKMADLDVARHDVDYYKGEFARTSDLLKRGHAAQAKFERVRRDWLMSKQKIEAIRQDIAGVLANLSGDAEIPTGAHPRVLEAEAERERALLDLDRTVILAPRSGIVTNFELQVGEYVTAATPVFSIVADGGLWIEANLKETDLTHVREGLEASVRVDAYPDHVWRATVTGISAATGAEFALLPPQNASGNWVKVVQRLPVRLELERGRGDPPLRAGMSAEIEIDTLHERTLPRFVDSALAWATGQR